MNIDEKLKKLEEIANMLDNNEITFEKAIKLYEEGALLSKELYLELNNAKGKVTIIKQDLEKFKEEEMK